MLHLGLTRHLVFLACWVATAKAEGWDDFANNLATDLAPLLALFGEQVTKQFLSESITTLDNFIFAMAPLGIITAVVSAIRVCGAPSLRAFIGRANEGGGIAEAELCSSTSRDVCELYHNGAIVRVFGRPKILEFVHDPDFEVRGGCQTPPTCGIYPFREYIKTARAKEAGWEELGKRGRRGTESDDTESQQNPTKKRLPDSDDDDEDDKFAPNPNLSINIGIRKRSEHVMWLSAMVGFLAQASVLVVGFLVTYRWAWTKDDSLPPTWAFPLMSLGTVLLCTGMFSCALLVERSTRERVFRKSGGPATLHVVQPGNQIIGDQTFDSFSVAASLKEYTTSWKTPQHPATGRGQASVGRGEAFDRSSDGASPLAGKLDQLARLVSRYGVWLATTTTMAGFVLQFVGLRALHSVVSVVQLGAILLMSIIRASLRTQRLPQEQNRLRDRPDEVEGHELDWLALQMGKKVGVEDQARRSWSVIPPPPTPENDSDAQPQDPPLAERTFYYRSRLAELTSQSKGVESKSSTAWGEHLVHARQRAGQLRTAIESSTRYLSDHAQMNSSWRNPWTVDVVEYDSESSPSQRTSTARVSLYSPEHSNEPWGVNLHYLEAVVGLWAWSVISDPRTEKVDKFGLRASTASEVPAYRIVAAGATAEDIQRAGTELGLWADDFPSVSTMRWTAMPNPVERGPHTLLWKTKDGEISTRASPGTPKKSNLRLYGWPISHPSKPFVLVTRIDSQSVSATCAQEIFQSFCLCAVTAALDSPGGEIRPMKGRNGLDFATDIVSNLAARFERSGLGSKQDAYSVIIPALRLWSTLPLPSDALPVVHRAAEDTWKEGNFPEAEDMLEWAWNHSRSAETMVELGELYRHALFSKNGLWVGFGRVGISHMKQDAGGDDSVNDICNRYEGLLRKLADPNSNRHPTAQDIITAIARYDREDSLWLISQAEEVLTPDAGGRAVLSWAAQRGWLEVVKTAVEIGSVVDSEDNAKRTPLSYAAEHGHADVVRLLMDRGALPISEDSSRRTPLSYAAAEGHCDVMRVLLGDPRVTVDTTDKNGASPLHWAAKNGQDYAVELLLREKAQMIDDPDLEGRPPLMMALLNEQIHTAEMLVANGAKFDFRLEGSEAWRWAIKYGEWACAAFLLGLANRASVQKKTVIVKAFNCSSEHPEARNPPVLPEAAHRTEVVPYVVSEDGTGQEITMETVRRVAAGGYNVVIWTCEQGNMHLMEELVFDASKRFKVVGLLLDHLGEEVKVTEDVVMAAAGNYWFGKKLMKLILAERGKEVRVTGNVIKAAAGNGLSGDEVIELLLSERGKEVKLTVDVVKAAAANENQNMGEQVMELLLDGRAEIVDFEKVMEAMAREFGESVTKQLLAAQEAEVTDDGVKVAQGNVSAEQ